MNGVADLTNAAGNICGPGAVRLCGKAEGRTDSEMARRARKTAYFLNRTLNRLALIARGVRFPATDGLWVMVADAVRAPWETTEILASSYPEWMNGNPGFIALLTDFDVLEFESELQRR